MIALKQTLPERVNDYAIVTWRLLILSILAYLCVSFVIIIRTDLLTKYQTEESRMLLNTQECEESFMRNKCDGKRVPAIRDLCRQLEECITTKSSVTMITVLMKLLGECLEAFFSSVSGWSVLLFAAMVASIVGLNQYMFTRRNS